MKLPKLPLLYFILLISFSHLNLNALYTLSKKDIEDLKKDVITFTLATDTIAGMANYQQINISTQFTDDFIAECIQNSEKSFKDFMNTVTELDPADNSPLFNEIKQLIEIISTDLPLRNQLIQTYMSSIDLTCSAKIESPECLEPSIKASIQTTKNIVNKWQNILINKRKHWIL